ncbi:cytochrome c peroxidase [Flavobacterium arsenatis]|uniref:Cytochrome c peroxidase n=1 Tax=Flavobacterium arsenatis TaxID=1484332 RepID=A0ABU1TJK9_9FLAO|nr:cytochrome c peroxidase [Flavobacterium arsenatis]MDR6966114.1 cytochrome c peroxidase [Flavobacterium arsenatis]
MFTPYLKIKSLSFGLIGSLVTLAFFSFASESSYRDIPLKVNQQLLEKYADELNTSVKHFDNVADAFQLGKIPLDSLQNALSSTRLHYKKIEFILAFYYPEYVKEHLNGAPLLFIKKGTSPMVLEPEGLQVLDELVFSDEAKASKVQISALAKRLTSNYGLLCESIHKKKPTGNWQIKAMRLELVRIFTLGITGFDTPGSLNALPEATASMQGMLEFLNQSETNSTAIKDCELLFTQAIDVLKKANSFEAFDRLAFLKSYIDPLYAKLGALDGEASPEFLTSTSAWNSKSTSIFSDDFLDPYFFTDLKREEDSDALRALGKQLFYDPIISGDQKMSCATCHDPKKAFTDGNARSLSNLQGKTVLRNAPTLLNAVYADRFFYDLRAFTLEQQAEHVIFNTSEFNTAYAEILQKLNGIPEYSNQFKKLFGEKKINRDQFSKALASYVLSLNSFNSTFDQFIRNEINTLPEEVRNGFNLFMGKANCGTCHFAPTFSGLVPPFYNENESEILGVLNHPKDAVVKLDADKGRFDNQIFSEKAPIYEHSFKTTTVRNVGFTAPYFHNGAYKTLDEVVDFYNKGGGEGVGLSVYNQTLSPDPLDLNEKEIKDLIAFMKSLDDLKAIDQNRY